MEKLPASFYLRPDVVRISRELLGKYLFTKIDGTVTGGMIVETEAYAGTADRASHAYNNRRTARTEVMYREGGTAYVYLCYGIHSLFNVITNEEEVPQAVLVRAIEPVEGIEAMLERRKKKKPDHTLTSGPGALSAALGITCGLTGASLLGRTIWIAGDGRKVPDRSILASPRVGVDYAGKDAKRLWRFRIKNNTWIGKGK